MVPSPNILQADFDVVSMSKLRNSKQHSQPSSIIHILMFLTGPRLQLPPGQTVAKLVMFDPSCGQTRHSDTKTQEKRFKMSDSNLLLRSGYFTATF